MFLWYVLNTPPNQIPAGEWVKAGNWYPAAIGRLSMTTQEVSPSRGKKNFDFKSPLPCSCNQTWKKLGKEIQIKHPDWSLEH